jgi:hypothetical protein
MLIQRWKPAAPRTNSLPGHTATGCLRALVEQANRRYLLAKTTLGQSKNVSVAAEQDAHVNGHQTQSQPLIRPRSGRDLADP